MSIQPMTKSYLALSYVWGTDNPSYSIEINGQLFNIRRNLYDFLHRAQGLWPGKYLWVDALCINQGDENEKSCLVRKMDSIYSMSDAVIAWLGCNSINMRQLFRFVNNLQNPVQTLATWQSLREYPPIVKSSVRGYKARTPAETAKLDLYVRHLAEFCGFEYWTRLWILPEILLARTSVLMYDSEICDMKHFQFEVEHVMNPHMVAQDQLGFVRVCRSLDRLRGRTVTEDRDLYHLLQTHGDMRCRDVRDKVFALLTISNSKTRLKHVVDYSSSRYDLFLGILSQYQSQDAGGSFQFQLGAVLYQQLQLFSKEFTEVRLGKQGYKDIKVILEAEAHICSPERLAQQLLVDSLKLISSSRVLNSKIVKRLTGTNNLLFRCPGHLNRHFVVHQTSRLGIYMLIGFCRTRTVVSQGMITAVIPLEITLLHEHTKIELQGEPQSSVLPPCRECTKLIMVFRPMSYAGLSDLFESYLDMKLKIQHNLRLPDAKLKTPIKSTTWPVNPARIGSDVTSIVLKA